MHLQVQNKSCAPDPSLMECGGRGKVCGERGGGVWWEGWRSERGIECGGRGKVVVRGVEECGGRSKGWR